MHIAVDLDGTIDAAPSVFQSLLASLKSCGHNITILTGASDADEDNNGKIDMNQIASQKKNYLQQLGLGESYDNIVVLPMGAKDIKDRKAGDVDLHDLKAQWMEDNHVDIFIDNSVQNAKAAVKAGIPLVLVPWATKQK